MNIDAKSIQVRLPDGSVRTVPAGTTPLSIAAGISQRLAAAAVVAQVSPIQSEADHANRAETAASKSDEPHNEASMYSAEDTAAERLIDLSAPLEQDVTLRLLTEK
ncbi:MAG: TGS domain-containing protein, partial [Acidobacteriaceae bacterium]